MTRYRQLPAQKGFTLVEAIVAMVILGIVSGIVAMFIRSPIQGYVDALRRAELTAAADTALRRLARDVHLALPNSLRLTDGINTGACLAGICYLEFIATTSGGRYRDAGDGSTAGAILPFSTGRSTCTPASNCQFDVLGPLTATAGDAIVINNLGSAPADAYNCTGATPNCNRATIAAVTGNTITLVRNPFGVQSPPLPSPAARFQVVPSNIGAITYSCPLTVAGTMRRYAAYGFNAVQATPPASGATTLLDKATCSIKYTAVSARTGLLVVQVNIMDTASGESVAAFQEIHVDNTP